LGKTEFRKSSHTPTLTHTKYAFKHTRSLSHSRAQCTGGKRDRCRPGMDNKFVAPGSKASNAWCCNCAKEKHAWHEFDRSQQTCVCDVASIHIHYVYSNAEHSMLHRFACRHCVKRDKQRPQSAVPSTPHQQTLRCSSHLPQVGRQSAAACRSSTDLVQTIPAALPAGNLQVTHTEAVSVSQHNHTCMCVVNRTVHMCWCVYVYKYGEIPKRERDMR